MNKTYKSFRKHRILRLQKVCLKTEILRKLRQVWTETHQLGWDKFNNGYHIFEFGFGNFIFSYPCESYTLTNWRHWKQTKIAPRTHLLQKSISLAQSQGWVGQWWRWSAIKFSHFCVPSSKLTSYPIQTIDMSWGFPRMMNQPASQTDITQFRQNPAPQSISQESW